MKNVARIGWLSVAASLVLLACPLLAQHDTVRDTGLRPDSKGGIAIAPTIVGEIVEVEENAIVLDTVVGKEYVVRVPQTDVDADLKKGETVAVDFHRTAHGVRVAAQIRQPSGEDEKSMKRMRKDYDQALRGEYEFTSTSDGSHQAKAKGGTHMGHTMTGTVVAVKDDQIVVSTSTGEETLVITPRTKWSYKAKAGDQVAVDFNRSEHQVPIATEIRKDGPSQ